jgi:O-antigen/teichoic acid export membrane protein
MTVRAPFEEETGANDLRELQAGTELSSETEPRSLRRSIVRGVIWTGGLKWVAQLISWPIMIVIARVLHPSDFGFIALVSVWTRLIMLLTEGGVGGAIILGPPLERRQLHQLNVLALALSALAFLLAVGIAFPIARFYRSADLGWVMIAIASTFLLEGAMLIPTARLRREMRFRELAIADAARALTDSLVTLTTALLGMRYWALVAGYGSGVVVAAAAAIYLAPTKYEFPRWADIGGTLRQARHLLATSLASFLYASADIVVAGRLLGASATGAYSFAGTIAQAPGDKLVSVLTRVTPSLFGALGSNKESTRAYVEKLTRLLAMALLPVFLGIAAVAPTLIPLLLGSRWQDSVMPLQLLCLYATMVSVTTIVPQVLQAAGRAHDVARNSLIALVIYPPVFYLLGSRWGVVGIAAGWVLVTPLLVTLLILRMCRVIELPLSRYAAALLPATLAGAVMVASVRAVAHVLAATAATTVLQLSLQILTGVAAYTVSLLVLDGPRVVAAGRELRHRVRQERHATGRVVSVPDTAP